jgi:hypothetical protein
MPRSWSEILHTNHVASGFTINLDASGLLLQTSGYDVGDKKKHLLEDICTILVVRSSRIGL